MSNNKYQPNFLGYEILSITPPGKFTNPLLCQPKSLFELAVEVVNAQPKPEPWNWSPSDVAEWVATQLNLPQYRDCFIKNNIMGKRLITIEANELPHMNITDFEHIKIITDGIREMLKIDYERFTRSVCLPRRYPEYVYLHYLYTRGRDLSRVDVFRIWKILKDDGKNYSRWDLPCYEHPYIIGLPQSKLKSKSEITRTLNMQGYRKKSWENFLKTHNLVPPNRAYSGRDK